MTDEEKDKLVAEVMQGFDFEKARSIMYLTKKFVRDVPTISELKKQAEKKLRMALEHQDREFGGLVVCTVAGCAPATMTSGDYHSTILQSLTKYEYQKIRKL